MASVLFIHQDSAYPQMGVLYLMDALAKRGIESELLSSGVNPEHLKAVVEHYRPDVVGMSVLTAPQLTDFIRHSVFLKERYPDVRVVWGGNHPTLLPDLCAKSWFIDHVFTGQGEIVFPQTVEDIVAGKEVPKIVRGYGPPRIDDFEPAWEKDAISRYLFSERHSVRSPDTRVKNVIHQSVAQIQKILEGQSEDERGRFLALNPEVRLAIDQMQKWDVGLYQTEKELFYYLLTSRGCPYKCTFCSEPLQVMHGDEEGKFLFNAHGPEWFEHQIDRIQERLAKAGKKMDGIGMWDDMFWIKHKTEPRCDGILEVLKSRGLGYLIEARADQLMRDDGLLTRKLAESGCIQVFVGAESISQETLNYMKKGTKSADYRRLIQFAGEYQVALRMSFIVGFPNESDESVNQTIDFCEAVENGDHGPWVNISGPKIFTPYPGTEEFARAIQAGFIPPETHEQWGQINRSTEEYLRHFPWMERNYRPATLKRLENHFGRGYKALAAH
ncbi:MAG TPA: radical SAM protein [Thermoplasmata archaeon]|nr:radical SAM protein [Thermoplasmata archaeon]